MILLSAFFVKAQLSTSFFLNTNASKIGVGYQFSERTWADLRIYSGTAIDYITPELTINRNFIVKENYDAYIGGGIIISKPLNGFLLPLGVAVKPFENQKNLSFNIEFNPLYEWDEEELFVRGFVGLRYRFK